MLSQADGFECTHLLELRIIGFRRRRLLARIRVVRQGSGPAADNLREDSRLRRLYLFALALMLIAFRCIVSISVKLRLDMLEHHDDKLLGLCLLN